MTGSTFAAVVLRLLKPDGSQLGLAATYRAATGFIDALDVPTTGTYTLVVDPTGASTGSASFTVYDIAADAARQPVTLPAGAGVRDRHGDDHDARPERADHLRRHRRPARRRRHLVDHADGRHDVDPAPRRLGAEDRRPHRRTPSSTAATLDANGTHTLKLDASDASTGTVTFTVYNVPGDVGVPTPISIVPAQTLSGGTAAATITTPGQDAWFAFTGTAGQRIAIKIAGSFLKSGSLDITDPSDNALGGTISFGVSGGWGDPMTAAADRHVQDPGGRQRRQHRQHRPLGVHRAAPT